MEWIAKEALIGCDVQALVGHGTALVEASSNDYLEGDSRLTADHEELLRLLGWEWREAGGDDPDVRPGNWSLPIVRGDWVFVAEMLSATLIGVFGFSQYLPITVRTFLCDSPCRACSWPDETVTST